MIWKDTQVRAEQRFNELNVEYQSLVSDQKNRDARRQPSREIKDYYNNALSLRQQGDMPNALRFISISLNNYHKQLGIRKDES